MNTAPNIERGFIMLADGGNFVCTVQRINDFENVLRGHYGRQRHLKRSMFNLDCGPVDVAIGAQDVLCRVSLPSLVIDTQFEQVGDFLVPVFAQSARSLRMQLTWGVPHSMDLSLAMKCAWTGSRWSMGECYMAARKQGAPGFRRLPLPNLYDDGRVCMGDLVRGTIYGATVEECFKRSVDSFKHTTWNTDLRPDAGRTNALFRWTPARDQVPVPDNWEAHCYTFSRVEMEELCPA